MKHYDKSCIIKEASICISFDLIHTMIIYVTARTLIAIYESLVQLIVEVCVGIHNVS